MKRIAFIIPYIGNFNNYFNLWLQSCRNNPTIDWYILTDNKVNYDYPDNVHKIETSMSELRKRFNNALGFNVALERPYKFCDLKPTYGYVFNDIIRDYDFWGYCDVDLIFGNIRKFFTNDLLGNYDMISRWAHCTLIRNNDMNNKLFMTHLVSSPIWGGYLPTYKDAFCSTKSYIFDEVSFIIYAMCAGLRIYSTESIHYDSSINYKYFHPAWHHGSEIKSFGHDMFYYNNGELSLITANRNEIQEIPLLYAHFQKRHLENNVSVVNSYCIANNKFINIPKPKTSDEVIRLSPRPIIDLTPQKRFLQRVRRKLFPKRYVQFYHWPTDIFKLRDKKWNERYVK